MTTEQQPYRYVQAERRPVEVLGFQVDPRDIDEFLRIDHEVWTRGEAASLDERGIPFISKEVWAERRPAG